MTESGVHNPMHPYNTEQEVSVGIAEGVSTLYLTLEGQFVCNGRRLPPGRYRITEQPVALVDHAKRRVVQADTLRFVPSSPESALFFLDDIRIGREFHWERSRRHSFKGSLCVESSAEGGLTVINHIPVEQYLTAVISSEMNPRAPGAFLKAHCIISRSWLLCQMTAPHPRGSIGEDMPALSWTDAHTHTRFDVCADDHCQRYHGTGCTTPAASQTVAETRGEVLMYGETICDTRFSKCCGGITERFSTAWEDTDYPYLQPVADVPAEDPVRPPHPGSEKEVEAYIRCFPSAWCNVSDPMFLRSILPSFDLETETFFRWQVELSQEELQAVLLKKTGIAFGAVTSLQPLSRGPSGRIYRLKITGRQEERVIGKELVIRRALSETHLYSAAFIVECGGIRTDVPEWFRLTGAGWGHGVGLCQIGAAHMAAQGYDYRSILMHYFKGAKITTLY